MNERSQGEVPPYERFWALFLDVDGTLLDFVEDPETSRASPDLVELLDGIRRWSEGALVLVSGRAIESVDRIFAPLRLPTAGLHGLERRDSHGSIHRAAVDPAKLRAVRRRLESVAEKYEGAFVEDKALAVALHYRRAAEAADDAERLARELESSLPEPLCVQRGKKVVEVRSGDHSKGTAIGEFMNEPGLRTRTPVFVGDDLTDEHGFEWVNQNGGHSIKVGPGPTEARYRLDGVQHVHAWLRSCARFLQRQPKNVT